MVSNPGYLLKSFLLYIVCIALLESGDKWIGFFLIPKFDNVGVHCAAGAVGGSPDGGIMMVAGALSQVGSQRLQHLPKIARAGQWCRR